MFPHRHAHLRGEKFGASENGGCPFWGVPVTRGFLIKGVPLFWEMPNSGGAGGFPQNPDAAQSGGHADGFGAIAQNLNFLLVKAVLAGSWYLFSN